jgi:hypothetical protein
MSGLLARVQSFWRALRRPTRLEAEMNDEMRFHIEMEAERLARERGLDPAEALRQAAIAFGGMERRKQEGREIRGLASVSSLSADLKLGLRMMVRHPMLTLVGGIALTVVTAIGVGASEFMRDLLVPELPFEDGDRIVRLYQIDSESGGPVSPSLYDLEVWRESLSSLQDLGAYTTMEQGLLSDRGEAGTVSLARISASAFRVTRVPPLLGRFLLDADERAEAPPVVVLGYLAWQTLLGGDPDPIGRTVRLGGIPTVVVGIMPEGYLFPQTQNVWAPLLIDPAGLRPESAPRASLFARLAPGRISRLFFIIQQAPQPPFWWNDALSPATVAYGIVLAVAGALIIGVVPALKATGGAVGPRLGRLPAGGGGGLHFGGIWTVVIVLQVALSVALIPLAVSLGDARSGLLEPRAGTALEDSVAAGFPADEYLTAELGRESRSGRPTSRRSPVRWS